MGDSKQTLSRLEASGVIAVLRGTDPELLTDVARVLADEGIEAIEITFTVPAAHQVIEKTVAALGDTAVVGAGTVLDAETARLAILSGAAFLVSPVLDEQVVTVGHRYGVPVFPGAFTPTEVLRAWSLGVHAVKLFPADIGGPQYLKALRGPLPQVRLIPTGGVTPETIPDFYAAGAWCVAAGGALAPAVAARQRQWEVIRQRARAFRAAVERARSGR